MDNKVMIARADFMKTFVEFMEEDELVSREFWAHFSSRKASLKIPFEDLFECVDNSVCYDATNQFDLRILMTVVFPKDRKLFIDVATFVVERYVDKPAGPLTLRQFKADLTRRLIQTGF